MGIAYDHLKSLDLIVIVWDGLVSGAEWAAFAEARLAEDPSWPPARRMIADVTRLDPSSLTSDDVENVTAIYRARPSNMKGMTVAIVASAGWQIAVEFERHIDRLGSTTIVFNDVEGACRWLGLNTATTRRVIGSLHETLTHQEG